MSELRRSNDAIEHLYSNTETIIVKKKLFQTIGMVKRKEVDRFKSYIHKYIQDITGIYPDTIQYNVHTRICYKCGIIEIFISYESFTGIPLASELFRKSMNDVDVYTENFLCTRCDKELDKKIRNNIKVK